MSRAAAGLLLIGVAFLGGWMWIGPSAGHRPEASPPDVEMGRGVPFDVERMVADAQARLRMFGG